MTYLRRERLFYFISAEGMREGGGGEGHWFKHFHLIIYREPIEGQELMGRVFKTYILLVWEHLMEL